MQDPSESLVVVGRYISENYNGAALHPIDFIDISTGQLIAEVMDPNITTISPVNKLHPQYDVLASGSSRYSHALNSLIALWWLKFLRNAIYIPYLMITVSDFFKTLISFLLTGSWLPASAWWFLTECLHDIV